MKYFGQWLLSEQGQRGMSQSDLESKCQFTRVISGKGRAGTRILANISLAFNLPFDFGLRQAGFLPSNEPSPACRTLLVLARQMPDKDVVTQAVLSQPQETKVGYPHLHHEHSF